MKNLFIVVAFAVASLSIVACNNGNKTSSANSATDSTASPKMASADVKTKPGVDANAAESVKGLVADYLQLKNALTKDNSNYAAKVGKG